MQWLKENKSFLFNATLIVALTFILLYYTVEVLFYGKNSYAQYEKLQNNKAQLQYDIKRLQIQNANLQKQYLELKNLEPEEL